MDEPKVRRGWRHFRCDECSHEWDGKSRDAFSPSGEDCPKCGEWVTPEYGVSDESLPCDEFGNLRPE